MAKTSPCLRDILDIWTYLMPLCSLSYPLSNKPNSNQLASWLLMRRYFYPGCLFFNCPKLLTMRVSWRTNHMNLHERGMPRRGQNYNRARKELVTFFISVTVGNKMDVWKSENPQHSVLIRVWYTKFEVHRPKSCGENVWKPADDIICLIGREIPNGLRKNP